MPTKKEWSTPYYGVTHYGQPADKYWITVNDLGKVATLHKWFPGCGFSPLESTHPTVVEARRKGERWVKQNCRPH